MKYHFKVHKQDGGYWAECLELDGCATQGESMAHLRQMMEDALNVYLNEKRDSKHIFPLPNPHLSGRGIVSVQADPLIAMAMIIRQLRVAGGMTQQAVADKMGMKSLYSYQRLEKSTHANLELETMAKLKKVYPTFSVDEVLA